MKSTKFRRSARLPLGVFVALLVIGVIIAVVVSGNLGQTTPTPQVIATIDPAIAANLTALPQAAPLEGAAADEIRALEAAVMACNEYSAARRDQMQQHINWLMRPNEIPPQMIMAFGANTTGRLIYGMAFYTSTEWRLSQRPAQSCLRDIGLRLNELLVANNEDPFTIYEETTP